MKILYLIPARKGSKGLPGKNVKVLHGKPLISYSIDFALANMKDGDELFVSTNDEEVISIAESSNVPVPIMRPEHLSSDVASSYDVIRHALGYFRNEGKEFEAVMLLQPTSPFRTAADHSKVLAEFDDTCEMVVTVKLSKDNPYFNVFEETELGFLKKSKEGGFSRRQDCPPVYAFNGSIYLIRVQSLETLTLSEFTKIRKVIMPDERSVDIDTMADWVLAEYFSDILIRNENS